MRLSQKFCAIVSSVALTGSVPVLAQTPPPAETPSNDAATRDALRKALESTSVNAAAGGLSVSTTIPLETKPNAPKSVFAPSGAPAPASLSLGLTDAIKMALENNLDLQVQRYTPIIAEFDRRSLYGAYDPVLNLGVNQTMNKREAGGINLNTGNSQPGTRSEVDAFNAGLNGLTPWGMTYGLTHNLQNPSVTTPFLIGTNSFGQPIYGRRGSDTWSGSAGVTLSQHLLKGAWIDDTRLALKLKRRDIRVSELAYELKVMEIVKLVETAYYTLIGARETVRVSEAALAVNQQFLDEQNQRVKVGTLSQAEAKLAEAQVAQAKVTLLDNQRRAVDAEAALKSYICGNFASYVPTRIDLTDKLLAVPSNEDLHEAFREAIEKRPDLQQQRIAVEKLQIQLKYDKHQLMPSLDLTATWGANGLDNHLGGALDDVSARRYPNDFYGVTLSFPLTFQSERNRIKSTEAAKAQAILELKRQEEVVLQGVENIVRLQKEYWQQIPLTRDVTAARQIALDAEKKKLETGKSTSFQVLEITSDLTSAQVQEIIALMNYNIQSAELAFRKGATLERWKIDPPAR